jgi:hypothetical protein
MRFHRNSRSMANDRQLRYVLCSGAGAMNQSISFVTWFAAGALATGAACGGMAASQDPVVSGGGGDSGATGGSGSGGSHAPGGSGSGPGGTGTTGSTTGGISGTAGAGGGAGSLAGMGGGSGVGGATNSGGAAGDYGETFPPSCVPGLLKSQRWFNAIASSGTRIVAAGGDDDIINGGAFGGVAFESTDGTTWRQISLPPGTPPVLEMVYGDGEFVATAVELGDGVKPTSFFLLRSQDGLAWTLAPDPGGALAYGNGTLLMAGGYLVRELRKDGTWRDIPLDRPVQRLVFGSGSFVAFGEQTLGTFAADQLVLAVDNPVPPSGRFTNLQYLGGMFVGEVEVGDPINGYTSGKVQSSDGQAWSYAALGPQEFWVHAGSGFGAGVYVVPQQDAAMLSVDLQTWIRVPLPTKHIRLQTIFSLGRFLIVGRNSIVAGTPDGLDWQDVYLYCPFGP